MNIACICTMYTGGCIEIFFTIITENLIMELVPLIIYWFVPSVIVGITRVLTKYLFTCWLVYEYCSFVMVSNPNWTRTVSTNISASWRVYILLSSKEIFICSRIIHICIIFCTTMRILNILETEPSIRCCPSHIF